MIAASREYQTGAIKAGYGNEQAEATFSRIK